MSDIKIALYDQSVNQGSMSILNFIDHRFPLLAMSFPVFYSNTVNLHRKFIAVYALFVSGCSAMVNSDLRIIYLVT